MTTRERRRPDPHDAGSGTAAPGWHSSGDPLFPATGRGALLRLNRGSGSNSGLTLVEVMIGIFIFSFALMPIMGLFGRGSMATQMTGDYLTAMQTCSSYLRSLSALPAVDLPIGNPVPLDREFGGSPTNRVKVPSKSVINATEFAHRLQVRYVTRNTTKKDLWFDFMVQPGQLASMTVYKQFLRLDFEVSWRSRHDGQSNRVRLFTYKADLE
ncbi:MAG: hypothetical protein BWY66_00449 [bacterium ADurb.Bin374]|nr:MAG: hypothetical protein BWY66_00449 [bacterium ADurb.Bin374]